MAGRGYIEAPAEVAARRQQFQKFASRGKAAALIVGALSLPLATSNRSFVSTALGGPGILDQDGTDSCCGHGAAGCITSRFAILKTPIPLVSPIGCQVVGWDILRLPNHDGTYPLFTNTGADPDAIVQGTQSYGVCSAADWGNYPANPSTIILEPTPAQLEAAKHFVLSGTYFLGGTQAQILLQLLQALASGYPVSNALASSSAAFNAYSGGIIAANALTGAIDHYTYFIDYTWLGDATSFAAFVAGLQAGNVDATAIGNLMLFGVNSWGETWGESDVPGITGGLYRILAGAVAGMAAMAVWDVSKPAGGVLQ